MTRMDMSLVSLSSVLAMLVGCAHDESPGLRMLETRADYDAAEPEAQTLTLASAAASEGGATVPVRLPPKVVNVWVHAHETADHEYFWGAWLSVVVAGEEWGVQFQDPATAGGEVKPKKQRATKKSTK